jgi:tRNA(Ile)-lysidine synthase
VDAGASVGAVVGSAAAAAEAAAQSNAGKQKIAAWTRRVTSDGGGMRGIGFIDHHDVSRRRETTRGSPARVGVPGTGRLQSYLMEHASLLFAVGTVPGGAWAVGVSGGADSVALLRLLRLRDDLSLRVAHLDHQLRGNESDEDAAFVGRVAESLGLPLSLTRLREIEVGAENLPANPSARYRAARMAFFKQVCEAHSLGGVILAHHADDQAETVLQRLLRSSAPGGLAGMAPRSCVDGLLVLRPLLGVSRAELREFMGSLGQTWREDSSNASGKYLRNRIRLALAERPELRDPLLRLGERCRGLKSWVRTVAPELPPTFAARVLWPLPAVVARESCRRWLIAAGAPGDELTGAALDRLIAMAVDAASPPRQHFPGRLLVRRRGGEIFVESQGA